ncbi:MAG: DUF1365 domain-containing protein [Hyphomonas sp.]|nr:DUF1365 domain-containing protein [Hyphomonas sp.]
MTGPALSLWKGKTVHARFAPFQRRFAYDLVLIEVDIDRLDEADAQCGAFSVGKPNLFSFRTEDHGPRVKGAPLRPWAEEMFAKAGVALDGGVVRLTTFPRHLFYKFAPISLWYGYGQDGGLRGVIYEVNNTFGDTHCYVAATGAEGGQHAADKALHVSPFFDVSGQYRFTLRRREDRTGLVVDNMVDGTRLHVASIVARRQPVTSGRLLQLALANPMSTLGVTIGIHWQALWIWLKGAGYRRRPAAPEAASIALPAAAPRAMKEAA